MAFAQLPSRDDRLDRRGRRHRVEVGAEQDARLAAPGDPREQVAAVGADRRAGVVLVGPRGRAPRARRSRGRRTARSSPDGLAIRHSARERLVQPRALGRRRRASRSRRRREAADVAGPGSPASAARASAAPTNSRNSGAGRFGRDLNSGWNCEATKNGCVGAARSTSTRRPSGRGAEQHEPAASSRWRSMVVDLVAVAVALVDDRPRRRSRARASRRAARPARAPSRIVPPRSSISFCSGSRSITGIRRLGVHLGRVGALHARRRGARTRRPRRACRGRCRGTGSASRARSRGERSCPRSRGSRSRRGPGPRRRRASRARPRARSTVSESTQSISTSAAVVDAGVPQRLGDRQVGVVELDVLADERDPHRRARRRGPVDDRSPARRDRLAARRARSARRRSSSTPSSWNVERHEVDVRRRRRPRRPPRPAGSRTARSSRGSRVERLARSGRRACRAGYRSGAAR